MTGAGYLALLFAGALVLMSWAWGDQRREIRRLRAALEEAGQCLEDCRFAFKRHHG